MSDYKKLVEELKSMGRACYDCQYYGLDCMRENEVCILADAAAAIEELQAELPKRGEWVEDTKTYAGPCLSNYKCSLCGKISGTWRRGLEPSELPNWCGNCGADMRKMEVSE